MISHEVSYRCPYCDGEFAITVADAVSTDDQDEKESVLSGDIFKHACPHCRKEFLVQNEVICSDRERRFLIWLSKREPDASLRRFSEPLVKQGYKLRRVKTIDDFLRKAAIFLDGMDDVAVELARFDSFIEFVENRKGEADQVTSVDYQGVKNDVVKINVRTGDKGMAFLIPLSVLEEEASSHPGLYEFAEASFPVIDSSWITSFFAVPKGSA